MLTVPPDLSRRYDAMLERSGIAPNDRPFYRKWLRYYLDFCHKYHFDLFEAESVSAFDDKLRQKNQSQPLRKQACHAVFLYHKITSPASNKKICDPAVSHANSQKPDHPRRQPHPTRRSENSTTTLNTTTSDNLSSASRTTLQSTVENRTSIPLKRREKNELHPESSITKSGNTHQSDRQAFERPNARDAGVRQNGASWEWVFNTLESAIKVRHYSPKTLKAYRAWTQKFQAYVKSKDPSLLAMDDVRGFLSFLAVEKNVLLFQPKPGIQRFVVPVQACPGKGFRTHRRRGQGKKKALHSGGPVARRGRPGVEPALRSLRLGRQGALWLRPALVRMLEAASTGSQLRYEGFDGT